MEILRGADKWPGWHIMKQEDDKVVVLGLCVHFVDILEILEIISNNIFKTYSTNSQKSRPSALGKLYYTLESLAWISLVSAHSVAGRGTHHDLSLIIIGLKYISFLSERFYSHHW